MARKRRRNRSSSSGSLAWLLAGILVGLLIAGGVWWLQSPSRAPDETEIQALLKPPENSASSGQSGKKQAASEAGSKKDSPYDFYHLLSRMEVIVPEEELGTAARQDRRTEREGGKSRYLLQVGAFRTHRQADELKAKLALLGFEARIQRIETDRGTWHRVRLGPYENLREVDRVRHALRKHHFDAIAVRVK